MYPKKQCLNIIIFFSTKYIYCHVLFYDMFWQYNQIMHYILNVLSINMTWYISGVMTALGLWVWAMWPKLLDGYSYLSKKMMNMFIFYQNEIHLLFDLEQMLAIRNFTHNSMSIYYSTFWSHHYVIHARKPCGRRRNHFFCLKIYQLIVCSGTNEGHLAFFHHLRNIKWPTYFHENPLFENIYNTSYVSITSYHMDLVIKHARLRVWIESSTQTMVD